MDEVSGFSAGDRRIFVSNVSQFYILLMLLFVLIIVFYVCVGAFEKEIFKKLARENAKGTPKASAKGTPTEDMGILLSSQMKYILAIKNDSRMIKLGFDFCASFVEIQSQFLAWMDLFGLIWLFSSIKLGQIIEMVKYGRYIMWEYLLGILLYFWKWCVDAESLTHLMMFHHV